MSDVVNNEQARRFEVTVDGHTGYLQYSKSSERINLIHTEVPKELGGRGIGGMLAKAALEYARQANLQVIPSCPFVKSYVERHPEYAALTN